MRNWVLAFVLAVSVSSFAQRLGSAADEEAILKIRDAHNLDYNNHDAKALSNLYAPDGDRIRNNGSYHKGRAQIEASYVNAFKEVSKNSTVKDESSKLRFLTADVALVDVDDIIQDGPNTHKNHVATIYVKRDGHWVLVAERSVRIE
jgi:uncharacterized protein (TIGR02246 family)